MKTTEQTLQDFWVSTPLSQSAPKMFIVLQNLPSTSPIKDLHVGFQTQQTGTKMLLFPELSVIRDLVHQRNVPYLTTLVTDIGIGSSEGAKWNYSLYFSGVALINSSWRSGLFFYIYIFYSYIFLIAVYSACAVLKLYYLLHLAYFLS